MAENTTELGGGHAALSAVLGGIVNIAAVVVFAVVLFLGRPRRRTPWRRCSGPKQARSS